MSEEKNEVISNSILVESLEVKTKKELNFLLSGLAFKTKKMAKAVILHKKSYNQVAEDFDVSKSAVYDLLKRLYKRKHGVEYGKKKQHSKDIKTIA